MSNVEINIDVKLIIVNFSRHFMTTNTSSNLKNNYDCTYPTLTNSSKDLLIILMGLLFFFESDQIIKAL